MLGSRAQNAAQQCNRHGRPRRHPPESAKEASVSVPASEPSAVPLPPAAAASLAAVAARCLSFFFFCFLLLPLTGFEEVAGGAGGAGMATDETGGRGGRPSAAAGMPPPPNSSRCAELPRGGPASPAILATLPTASVLLLPLPGGPSPSTCRASSIKRTSEL